MEQIKLTGSDSDSPSSKNYYKGLTPNATSGEAIVWTYEYPTQSEDWITGQ